MSIVRCGWVLYECYEIVLSYKVSYNSFLQHSLQPFSQVFQLPQGRMLTYFGIVPEGTILDVPNAALGWLFYTVWLLLIPKLNNISKALPLLAASMAMASSVWLAIQLLILTELCLLCWSTHVINSRLWWCAFCNVRGSGGSNAKGAAPKIKRV